MKKYSVPYYYQCIVSKHCRIFYFTEMRGFKPSRV